MFTVPSFSFVIYLKMLISKCWRKITKTHVIVGIRVYIPRGLLVNRILSYAPSAAAAKSLQSCPTLCNPKDGSPPGSPVPGVLQARILEWVAISFSSA